MFRQFEFKSNNNVADIVKKHCDRIAFAHIRNVHHLPNGDLLRQVTEIVMERLESWILSKHIMKEDSRDIFVRIMDVNFGQKVLGMYDLDMDYMIEHLELCIFLEIWDMLEKEKAEGRTV